MKRSISLIQLFLLIIIASFIALSTTANAYTIKQAWSRISATAGETLATGDIVCIKDADGYAYKANASSSTLRPALGIVGKGATTGNKAEIIIAGVVSGWTALSEGLPGYLSETSGAVTQTVPAWWQQVGYAINTTDYVFSFQNALGSSSFDRLGSVSHDYGAAVTDWTMTTLESVGGLITITNASGPVNALLSSAIPGKSYVFVNGTAHTGTLKVTGQTGAAIAASKIAVFFATATDVIKAYVQP